MRESLVTGRQARRVLLLVAGAALGAAAPALAWGPQAHQQAVLAAIDTLPKELRSFYKDHRYELPTLALDAEPAPDTPDRRFLIDELEAWPFFDVPPTEEACRQAYADKCDSIGRLPWLVQESHARLVEAFRSGDTARILAESDTLAGYVADLHNPLAVTRNYDGQLTEQHGLWMRIGARLVEAMDKRIKLKPDAANYLDRPREWVFDVIRGAYVWVDNLLWQEDLARRGQGGFTETYFDALERRAGVLVSDRLSFAAEGIGSYWYTAWTDAGRPPLK